MLLHYKYRKLAYTDPNVVDIKKKNRARVPFVISDAGKSPQAGPTCKTSESCPTLFVGRPESEKCSAARQRGVFVFGGMVLKSENTYLHGHCSTFLAHMLKMFLI